jgi:hypothetical protein
MAPLLIATHFQWRLQSSLGTKTRMAGFSFGNLPRVYIRHLTGIITNQAMGLKEAIYQVPPNAAYFHCSFHRRQNITKIVKGGNVKYSCLWLFNKLVKAHTKQEINHIKHKHSRFVDKKVLKYLNSLDDKEVYPGVR